MKRISRACLIVLASTGLVLASTSASTSASTHWFPKEIQLPDGFRPEGIAIGPGANAFFGSLADGSIYRADLRSGRGEIISEGPGTPSNGIKTDRRGRLFVSGGSAGDARVIDTRTGEILKSYALASGEATFVNDVVLSRGAAWFTDSLDPVLYKLPLRRGLPDDAVRIPITGDLEYVDGFNANGIAPTPDRRGLLVVQSNTGMLFRADPATGETREVNLHGESLPNGDGLLLDGRLLYVVQNRLNTMAVLKLNSAGTSARVVRRISDDRFDVPTTVAAFGRRLYLPNARFTTEPTPETPYNAVAIRRPRR